MLLFALYSLPLCPPTLPSLLCSLPTLSPVCLPLLRLYMFCSPFPLLLPSLPSSLHPQPFLPPFFLSPFPAGIGTWKQSHSNMSIPSMATLFLASLLRLYEVGAKFTYQRWGRHSEVKSGCKWLSPTGEKIRHSRIVVNITGRKDFYLHSSTGTWICNSGNM